MSKEYVEGEKRKKLHQKGNPCLREFKRERIENYLLWQAPKSTLAFFYVWSDWSRERVL